MDPKFSAENIKNKDKEVLLSIVREMADSMTGEQSTRHWAKDALWFDIPAFASRGIQPALKMFDRVFGTLNSIHTDILEEETVIHGPMAIVCTVQKIKIVNKKQEAKTLFVRQTDCFEKRENQWQLIHQHVSVPSGGEWDGKIVT
jgi:ketosteroid isomerase-like protein